MPDDDARSFVAGDVRSFVAGDVRSFVATGLSMLPSVYPRDVLHVRAREPLGVALGDLVAYPGPRGMACHRVLRIEARDDGRHLKVRGDAQPGSEWLHESAVVYVVVAVEGRLGRWQVDGPRGRVLRELAVSDSRLLNALRRAAASALRGLSGHARVRPPR